MTLHETVQTLRVIQTLRTAAGDTPIVRRLEVDTCRQLYLDLEPGKPDAGHLLAIFVKHAETRPAQAVCLGIILGRPSDGAGAWRLWQ